MLVLERVNAPSRQPSTGSNDHKYYEHCRLFAALDAMVVHAETVDGHDVSVELRRTDWARTSADR
jgi:hypothetical protein